MASLRSNLIKRIQRLPKPRNVAGALIPLFEAVMNGIHATQTKYGKSVSKKGRVIVTVSTDRKKESVWATVEDNGPGLNEKNWDAFTTTDTDNKIEIGGKGVGRLMWLDCFENINVQSIYEENEKLRQKSFRFALSMDDQIQDEENADAPPGSAPRFFVKFEGLRANAYREKFPGRGNFIFQHLTSHFLPTFIGKRCPKVTVIVGDETKEFPEAINEIVFRRSDEIDVKTEEYGELSLTLMECGKVASADLKGTHFVHFIAHDRTVKSQAIDGWLGLKFFGDSQDRVFHAIVTGKYLDENVNQERTSFLFEDAVIDRIIQDVCDRPIRTFLEKPLAALKSEQQGKIELITASYPSVAFGDIDELQGRVPPGELKEDAIYGHLARERFRRDERQTEKIREVLGRLKDTTADTNAFTAAIADAGKELEAAEQRSLAEYVVRRKVVLDFIEILLEKVRDDARDSAYQREDILHSFICPMRVNTLTDGARRVEPASSHELWIIDERLTFTQYFSSDVDFTKLVEAADSTERPDLLIFDHVHGLRQTDAPSQVMLVEFKKPGRKEYADDENPQFQVERYVRRLLSGNLQDVKGRPIKLDGNTIFYCFIVADIVGKLDDWTHSWKKTVDGRGRIYRPDNGYNGSIELISWDSLLSDAKLRNRAFFDYAGITGASFFGPA